MKKFRFYALAAAFCALLVGAVAVSSPIEAEAFDTNNASADVQYAAGERETYLFDPDNGKPIGEYWLFDADGRLEAAEAGYTPAEGSSYIRAQLEGEDVKLTLSNVRPSENGALRIHAGNADVIIELIGENVLKSAGSPALNVGNIDGPESNLTITGSGSLTCYGAGTVYDAGTSSHVGAAVYAEFGLAVTGGAELYAYADEPVDGGTARAGDTAPKHGVFVAGDLSVEGGSAVEGAGGELNDFGPGSVAYSDGVHVSGGITVESGGSLSGAGSKISAASGVIQSYGVYAAGGVTVEKEATLTGLGGDMSGNAVMLISAGVKSDGALTANGSLSGTGGGVTGEGTTGMSSFGVDAVNVTVNGSLVAKAGTAKGSGDAKSAGIRAAQSDSLTVNHGGYLEASGGDVTYSEDVNSASYGLLTEDVKTVTINGEALLSGGSVTLDVGSDMDKTLYMKGSRGIYTERIIVGSGGKLTANGGDVSVTGHGSHEFYSVSAGIGAGSSLDIAEGAVVTADGGEAVIEEYTPGGYAFSMGVFLNLSGSGGHLTVSASSDGPSAPLSVDGALTATGGYANCISRGDLTVSAGAGYYGDGGLALAVGENGVLEAKGGAAESSECISAGVYGFAPITVDGRLSAEGGTVISNNNAYSAGIYNDDTDAAFTVNATGSVTAKGGGTGDDYTYSLGILYTGPVTINGKLDAKAAGNAELAIALGSEESISIADGAHVIADVTGVNEAEAKTALAAMGGLTLPSDYRWRTGVDALFTLSSAEKYEYEWETNNDAYVEIAPPEIPAAGVTLSESSLVLDVDETAQLTAAVVPEDTTDKLVWASSDPSVATVSQDGLVTAVGPGSAVITAAAGEASAACSVTVRYVHSGGGAEPARTYEIEIDGAIVGGTVETNLKNASAGSTIRVTATPNEGYELAYVTVDGERISGTSFTMPAHDVTVSAVFTRGAGFSDVAPGSWYYGAVEFVSSRGLMDGVSESGFNPDGTMTRAMVWAVLARMDGESVTGAGWIEAARAWAMREGVSDGTDPDGAVTREMLVTMLWRFAGEPATAADLNGYADGADAASWAADAFAWAIENMIVSGVGEDSLAPRAAATRAQCAAILMRFVQM